MSFLVDTNICSAHLRRPAGLMHRFVQHGGQLHVSTLIVAELAAGANLLPDTDRRLAEIEDSLTGLIVLDFGKSEALTFGRLRSELKRSGLTVNPMDLLIASTAISHNLTLVTHDVKHFSVIPDLRIEDWLEG